MSSAMAATYSPVDNASSDAWTTSTNWSATPASSPATPGQLTFVAANGTALLTNTAALSSSSTNDITDGTDAANGNAFYLNILDLGGKASATSGANAAINVSGKPLEFVSNGATLPVVNLYAANNTQTLGYTISNNLILTSNTTFQQGGNAGFSFNGTISGSGSLTKSGASTLVLGGNNSGYSGDITVSGGTLYANNSTTNSLGTGKLYLSGGNLSLYNLPGVNLSGRSVTVSANTTISGPYGSSNSRLGTLSIGAFMLTIDNTGSVYQKGVDFGDVMVTGAATLRIDNHNRNSSGVAANFGSVTIGDSVAPNTTTNVKFGSNSSYAVARSMQVNGSITDNANDASKKMSLQVFAETSGVRGFTLQLVGTNSYSGGTTVDPNATLLGTTKSLQGSIASRGSVTFDQTINAGGAISSGTYAGAISGTGSVTKKAAGTVIFTGGNSYTGSTSITGGTLTLDGGGSLATSNISITGGTLSGGTAGAGGTINYLVNSGASNSIAISGTGVLDISNLKLALNLTDPTLSEYVIANKPVGGAGITGTHFASVSGLGSYSIDYDGTVANPNSIVLVIPEPSTMALLLGTAGLVALGRRRQVA